MTSTVEAPLAGIRVLDTAAFYAAPLIATLLADHGAEVVKVEPPAGDVYRGWPAMFSLVGRRKRSITLDLASAEGRDLLLRLLPDVDVVVENLPLRLAEERGLTAAAMRAVKPSLVVVSASGFGPDGPYSDRPANGTVAEAFAGLTGLTGEPDAPPQLPSAPLGDALAAAFGAVGALAGIVRALRSGVGATVDVTVHEPLLHALGTTLSGWRPGTPPPQRDGGAMGVPLRGTFRTADGGWIAISATTPRHVQVIADLAVRAGADGTSDRDLAAAWIAGARRDEVIAALVAARVPATTVNSLDEVAADPHVGHRRSLLQLDGSTIVRPTPAIDGPTSPPAIPALGEANADVLGGWLGLTTVELDDLHHRGVI